MKTFTVSLKLLLPVIALINTAAYAQKLPALQTASLRAPASNKIDGKATEWGTKLQAYNKQNKLSYTIYNDDKNLYLTVYTPDVLTINKISQGGITLTVSNLLDKKQRAKAKNNPEVRYPYVNLAGANTGAGMANRAREFYNFKKDSLVNKRSMDSLVDYSNSKLAEIFKEIRVLGIKAIPDTLISIYNTDGIKVASSFNNKMAYTCEMAIPLKHLNLLTADGTHFSYNIKLAGAPTAEDWRRVGRFPPPTPNMNPNSRAFGDYQYLNTPTDFWGEYTLAK